MYKSKIAFRPLKQITNKVSKLMLIPLAKIAAILLLVAVFCQSCVQSSSQENKGLKINYSDEYLNFQSMPMSTFVFDSCEYILVDKATNWQSISHKGNCKYCAARKSSK
jgi:hypothetical protein